MLKVNLACGAYPMAGWTNVDIRDDVGADIVCDLFEPLPFGDGTVDVLRAEDFLEHIPPNRVDAVVAEWLRVIRPGGELIVKLPNMKAIAQELATTLDNGCEEQLIINIYGGHRWGPDGAWDTHHIGFTPAGLALWLEAHGFTPISNDLARNMTVVATR